MTKQSVMVIGGSGFIGSQVVHALRNHGHEVISYDIVHSYATGDDARWIRADILEISSLEKVLLEYHVDTIIHLVGLPVMDQCERNPHYSFLLNVMSLQNTLEAIRIADVSKIVFASSATVYGSSSEQPLKEDDMVKPDTVYGYHKYIAEQVIRSYSTAYDIKHVTLRLFNVYGTNYRTGRDVISIFIRRARAGEPLIVKGPNKYRDFVHVEDVAEAFEKAVTTNISNIVLNIGSGKKLSLGQLAKIVSTLLPVDIKEEKTSDDGTGLQADISLAKDKLGFNPRTPIEGINAYIRTCINSR